MDDVDLDMLAPAWRRRRRRTRALADLERELMNQGFLDRWLRRAVALSPKAMRQLGQAALRDVAQQLSGRHGERDTRRAGAAGELTGATRPWAFGDTEPWNVTRTLTNAVLRQAGPVTDAGRSASPGRRRRDPETETRTQAAVALLVDTCRSRWSWRTGGAHEADGAGAQPPGEHPVPVGCVADHRSAGMRGSSRPRS